jgi:hypothetical protein
MARWWAFIAMTLCGCEIVADIQDLHLTTPLDDSGSPDGSTLDASSDGTTISDASDAANDVATEAGLQIELIDDMEANNGLIIATKNRSGAWFTYNDGTSSGVQLPTAGGMFLPATISPARGSSKLAARTDGQGFTTWGAGMGFNVNDPPSGMKQGQRSQYDASSYVGFTFYARIGADAGSSAVRFNVPNGDTDAAGGSCTACSDYHGVNLTLTSAWQQFVVMYEDMHQLGFGVPSVATFAPKTMYGCEFKVDPNTAFDVWIDDIAFVLP